MKLIATLLVVASLGLAQVTFPNGTVHRLFADSQSNLWVNGIQGQSPNASVIFAKLVKNGQTVWQQVENPVAGLLLPTRTVWQRPGIPEMYLNDVYSYTSEGKPVFVYSAQLGVGSPDPISMLPRASLFFSEMRDGVMIHLCTNTRSIFGTPMRDVRGMWVGPSEKTFFATSHPAYIAAQLLASHYKKQSLPSRRP